MKKNTFIFTLTIFIFQNLLAQTPDTNVVYKVGEDYESTYNGYGDIEYIPGDLPIIITVPHDGDRERTADTYKLKDFPKDEFTYDLTALILARIKEATNGGTPHIIINNMHRNFFDANRRPPTTSDDMNDEDDKLLIAYHIDHTRAERAFEAFHGFIEISKIKVKADWNNKGHLFDIHRHGQAHKRTMFGMKIPNTTLETGSTSLVTFARTSTSSIKDLSDFIWSESANGSKNRNVRRAIRGMYSLGEEMADSGYRVVPAQDDSNPFQTNDEGSLFLRDSEGGVFYKGGYIVEHHSETVGIDATQIENDNQYLADASGDIDVDTNYANDLADAILYFMEKNYGITYDTDDGSNLDLSCSSYGTILRRGFHTGAGFGTVSGNNFNTELIDIRTGSEANADYCEIISHNNNSVARFKEDDPNASRIRTNDIDLENYKEVYIRFRLKAEGPLESADKFMIGMRTTSSGSYTTVATYEFGDGDEDDEFTTSGFRDFEFKTTIPLTSTTRFSFSSDLSYSDEIIYFDSLLITTCENETYANSPAAKGNSSNTKTIKEQEQKDDSSENILYPNPVKNTLFLSDKTYNSYVIYNCLGKKIKATTIKNSQIDVSNLKEGIYLIRIFREDNSSFVTKRFIKN